MDWRWFWMILVFGTVGVATLLYTFILVVDPYDTLPFSPELEREPVTTNQRFSFPALAASQKFDSAIFGTSTTRLLEPTKFNNLFAAHFVNLSMNSATVHEQRRLYDLFIDHHPSPRMIIFGLDGQWCDTDPVLKKFTFRPFPPWLYDGNSWNDALYLFNFSALEQAGRQFGFLTGLRPPKYGRDGYTQFLPPAGQYDIVKARLHIYGPAGIQKQIVNERRPQISPKQRRMWRYAAHAELRQMLSRLPEQAVKVLMFVPYHHVRQPTKRTTEWARWDECKQRLAALAVEYANVHTIDFMISSQITTNDKNYWDPLHYTIEVADQLAELIAFGVREHRGHANFFHYIQPEQPPN